MLRTFDTHDIRATASLDGRWDLVIAPERSDRGKLPKAYNRQIHVPAAWETLPGLENYRGTAWLTTKVAVADSGPVRFLFGGVSHTATVFLDGKQIGDHYDAFTPFEVVVPMVQAGVHDLVVEVDNAFGEHSALHIDNDYYTYGGITRPVEMQLLPPVSIARVHATPRKARGKWTLDVTVRLRRLAPADGPLTLVAHLAGDERVVAALPASGHDDETVSFTLGGLDVEPWAVNRPRLYELGIELMDDDGQPVDDLIDRVGFREVQVKGKQLLFNGEPIRLRGYNRHEDHPHYGNALPPQAMLYDLERLRDLGCNFIRTCHYPNDQRFLDLCDELGFYVWEESHARNIDFKHPRYTEQMCTSTAEMVDWHFNHPSIIIWGCLNECESETKPGRKHHERQLRILKDHDGSRPVTFASNRWERDLCLDLVDIVSWNLYPGWYGGGPESVAPRFEECYRWLQSATSGGKGKPVIMSEFGGGAIYGNHEPEGAKWSEEYQAELLRVCLEFYLNHPGIVGAAIWQFTDVRVTPGWSMQRPNTINNKGTLDRYRRPKLAYQVVKAAMHAAAKAQDGKAAKKRSKAKRR